MRFSTTALSLLLVVLGSHVLQPAQADDVVYADFEFYLQPPSSPTWPNTSSTSVSNAELWQSLSDAANVPNLIINMTKVFDTVIFGVFSANPMWVNASYVVNSIVTQFNAKNPSVDVLGWKNQYHVQGGSAGYVPVMVPAYLRVSDEPDQTIFAILGGIAAFCVIVQFGYGYFHFQGFGFITRTDDERD